MPRPYWIGLSDSRICRRFQRSVGSIRGFVRKIPGFCRYRKSSRRLLGTLGPGGIWGAGKLLASNRFEVFNIGFHELVQVFLLNPGEHKKEGNNSEGGEHGGDGGRERVDGGRVKE